MTRHAIDVHIIEEGASTVVAVKGDIDIETAPSFVEQALPATDTAQRYVLEMSNVGFIDSSGVGAVVRIRIALQRRGLELHVVPSRRVQSTLKIAGLDTTIVEHANLPSAIYGRDSEPV